MRVAALGGFLALFALCSGTPAWAQPELEVLGTWGGAVNAVFIDEAVDPYIAYIGSGRRLVILNVEDPGNIVELGSIDLENLVMDVKVRDGYAYVCTFSQPNNFCVVDISVPASPQLVWHYGSTSSFQSREVELYGNVAYVRVRYDLNAFDISNPANPQNRGRVLSANPAIDALAVRADLLYVGVDDRFDPALRIYELLPDPFNPVLLGQVDLPYDAWKHPTGIVVEGNYAYLSVYGDGRPAQPGTGLAVMDVSDPQEPFAVGWFDDIYVTATDVALSAGYAYVPDWMDGVDPDTWDGIKGLAIVDVATDPTNPTLVGTFKTNATIFGVEVVGTRAYVMDEGEGLIILDISGVGLRGEPVRLGNWHSPAELRRMDKVGDLLYVTDEWNGITILDVADALHPALLGSYQTPLASFSDHGGIEVRNNLAYLAAGHSGFEIVDVSDTANPWLVGAYRIQYPEVHKTTGGVRLVGNVAHVIAQAAIGGLDVDLFNFDVSDPENIDLLGFVGGGGSPLSLDLRDGIAYVATTMRLSTYDTTDPENPVLLQSYGFQTEDCVLGAGNWLYVAAPGTPTVSGGLYVKDITDLANPLELIFETASGKTVGFQNGLVYLVATYEGWPQLLALDVSDPQAPHLVAQGLVPGAGADVYVEGRYAYVTGNSKDADNRQVGLAIVDLSAALCPGDLNGDGVVDLSDLATLLSNYGTSSGMSYEDGDLDGDEDVDLADLAELLAHYGEACA